MTSTAGRASALIEALNDRSRTQIGDPWRGTYHIAIDVTDQGDTTELLNQLQALGIKYQVNTGYRDRIAIYDLESQRTLLGLGAALDERTRKRLDTLVRARGPVTDQIRAIISAHRSAGKGFGAIAAYLNEKRIADGMGGHGWTSKKIEAAWKRRTPRRLRKREAA